MWMNVECWNNFLLSKSVWSGNAAIPRKGSSPLSHFLGNDQGRRGGRLYKLNCFENSGLHPDHSGHDASFSLLAASLLIRLLYGSSPKGVLGDLNLILVQPPGFSCWIDMVLDHKDNDHLVAKCPYSGPCGSVGTISAFL